MRRLVGWVVVLAACVGGPGCGNEQPRVTPTRIPLHQRLPRPGPDMGPGGGMPPPPGQAPPGKNEAVPPGSE
jgi:hypothetical protein